MVVGCGDRRPSCHHAQSEGYKKGTNGAVTQYYWIPDEVLDLSFVLNETDESGLVKANYIIGPNSHIGIVYENGDERYYVTDALGNVLALTDEAGSVTDVYEYDEFGISLSSSGSSYNPKRYTGQHLDYDTELQDGSEPGLYYLRKRFYDPRTGRFLTRDPIMSSNEVNRYVYVSNRPVDRVDWTGLSGTLAGMISENQEIIRSYQDWFSREKEEDPGDLVCDEAQRKLMKHYEGWNDALQYWDIRPIYAKPQEGGSYGHYAVAKFHKGSNRIHSIMDPIPHGLTIGESPRVWAPDQWRNWWGPIYTEGQVVIPGP